MTLPVPLPVFLLACCLKSDPPLGLFVDWAGGGSVVAYSIALWTYLGVHDVVRDWLGEIWW